MTDRYGMSLFLGVLKLLRDVSELVCEMLARDDLGELDGVERGSLAQIVVGDEEREALIVVDGLVHADAADEARRLAGGELRGGDVGELDRKSVV